VEPEVRRKIQELHLRHKGAVMLCGMLLHGKAELAEVAAAADVAEDDLLRLLDYDPGEPFHGRALYELYQRLSGPPLREEPG
jgi:hypothetical protein